MNKHAPVPGAGFQWTGQEYVCQCCGATTPLGRRPRHHHGCAVSAGIDGLSPREREIAFIVGRGGSNKDVANKLGISPKTVETHRDRVYKHLGISNVAQLARAVYAYELEQEGQLPQ